MPRVRSGGGEVGGGGAARACTRFGGAAPPHGAAADRWRGGPALLTPQGSTGSGGSGSGGDVPVLSAPPHVAAQTALPLASSTAEAQHGARRSGSLGSAPHPAGSGAPQPPPQPQSPGQPAVARTGSFLRGGGATDRPFSPLRVASPVNRQATCRLVDGVPVSKSAAGSPRGVAPASRLVSTTPAAVSGASVIPKPPPWKQQQQRQRQDAQDAAARHAALAAEKAAAKLQQQQQQQQREPWQDGVPLPPRWERPGGSFSSPAADADGPPANTSETTAFCAEPQASAPAAAAAFRSSASASASVPVAPAAFGSSAPASASAPWVPAASGSSVPASVTFAELSLSGAQAAWAQGGAGAGEHERALVPWDEVPAVLGGTMTVCAVHLGKFTFKGSADVIPMVNLTPESLLTRPCPADAPRGKGARVELGSGELGRAPAPLLSIVDAYRRLYRAEELRQHLEDAPATPVLASRSFIGGLLGRGAGSQGSASTGLPKHLGFARLTDLSFSRSEQHPPSPAVSSARHRPPGTLLLTPRDERARSGRSDGSSVHAACTPVASSATLSAGGADGEPGNRSGHGVSGGGGAGGGSRLPSPLSMSPAGSLPIGQVGSHGLDIPAIDEDAAMP
mmetsp:Transcript_41110/g.122693  ORF Transcript_41110/g.122693 Transcript_41110/m.122693 type:complete len:622 (-) Transcript_41110:453-2318(-)